MSHRDRQGPAADQATGRRAAAMDRAMAAVIGKRDIAGAIRLQQAWRDRVVTTDLRQPVRRVAGADVSFSRDGRRCLAGIVLMNYPELDVVEEAWAQTDLLFPYVPGLLSFREVPTLVAAARRLQGRPDLLLVDGQGRAHPRRFGLASHLGVQLDWPTIGCAKSRLIGEHRPVGANRGCACRLRDNGEVIGWALRSRRAVTCLYVSPGHRVSLADARRWTLRCCRGFRLPEPTRRAHQLVTKLRTHGLDKAMPTQ